MKITCICANAALWLLCLTSSVFAQAGGSLLTGMDEAMSIQREGLERMRNFLGPSLSDSRPVKRQSIEPTITFKNPAAQKFFVDGKTIPEGSYLRYIYV